MAAVNTDGLHVCQLHHDEGALSRDVARYVKEGIGKGSAVVVVAGDERRQRIQACLAESFAEGYPARLLTLIDSGDLLRTFMRDDGEPDRNRFRDALRPVLEAAAARGNGSLRVYGEMVNDLWRSGNPAGAVALERYWNELLKEYRFSLFCGYVLDAFDPASYNPCLEAVCVAHSHVAVTADEEGVRMAIDEACQRVLGIHLSSLLRHSQLADDKWHMRLPLSRRAILWLKGNTSSRFVQVLHMARTSYTKRAAATQP